MQCLKLDVMKYKFFHEQNNPNEKLLFVDPLNTVVQFLSMPQLTSTNLMLSNRELLTNLSADFDQGSTGILLVCIQAIHDENILCCMKLTS